MFPVDLNCDSATQPIGIENRAPQLGWSFASNLERGVAQTAYEVGVSSDRSRLDRNEFDLWHTGKVVSSANSVRYQGNDVAFGTSAWWKVRVWDQAGRESGWSDPARWVTGPGAENWRARWIGTPAPFGREHPLPIFRKSFKVGKPVREAVIFICGLGHFDLLINGLNPTSDVLQPAWTMYDKTALYVGHDVAPLLRDGENVLSVWIGQGMYNVLGGRYTKFKRSFGPHRLIAQLHLHYADGTSEVVISDESWRTTSGPITFTCIFGGEDHDATREIPGWEKPGFDDSGWSGAVRVDAPVGKLAAQESPPMRVQRSYHAITARPMPDGRTVYDMQQNLSGWPTLRVRGPRGAKVTLRPGELLDDDGFPNQKHNGSPVSYSYVLRGDPEETWRPRFSYTGFRYLDARVEGGDVDLHVGSEFVHASAPVVGQFECSNELFNRIHKLILNAALSNLSHVLTDCPHREKLGWLEQLHLMQGSLMWNYDLHRFMAKACRDMRDSQLEDGCVPTIAPEYVTFKDQWAVFSNSPEWGCSSVLVPWQAYERYGQTDILSDNYGMMKRYVDYLSSRATDGVIDFGLADWYDIGPGDHGFAKLTSAKMTGTTVYYQCAKALAGAAKVLGNESDASKYAHLATSIRDGFNRQLFNPETRQYDRGSQCACAMPLATGLVLEEHRQAVLDQLVHDIRSRGNHITAGDIGFRYVVQALGQAGRSDVLYDLLAETAPPSYGSQLAAGATTLTEAWDAAPKNSQNHLMLGHIESWFWESLAGLSVDLTKPVSERIQIRPQIVGEITWVNARHHCAMGMIEVQWERHGSRFVLEVTLPPNASARVTLPRKNERIQCGSGRHRWDIVCADP